MTSAGKKIGEDEDRFFSNFCDFLGDTDELTSKEIKAELVAEGIDVDKIITNVHNMVKAKVSESKRSWLIDAHAKRAEMLKKLSAHVPKEPLTITEIKERVRQLVSSGASREFAVAFRNYEHLGDDDLRKLYSDYVSLLTLKKDINEK